MVSDFQKKHIRIFLSFFAENPATPLDLQLRNYLKTHKSIGSKDRKIVGDTVYDMIRWKGLLDAHLKKPISWDDRLELFLSTTKQQLLEMPSLAPHDAVSFPKEFYDLLNAHVGHALTKEFCLHSNEQAPLTIRTNLGKTTRESLFEKLSLQFPVSLCKDSPAGILFHKKINFFELPEFKEGLFEIQDEASQLVADHVTALPGDEVFDFCAGAGGKSLAIAPKLRGKGQLFLHDIRPKSLQIAKQRLKKAGVQNAQILTSTPPFLHGRINWLLLDVPCSGSGTWRRNPDQKWKFSRTLLDRIIEEQRAIFEKALPLLHPKGKIIYATCSILPEENEEQIAYFKDRYQLRPIKPFFKSLPKPGEKDGFFAAVLEKSSLG